MDIGLGESTLKGALDQYYSWLVNLMGPQGNDRVALFSTVLTHDVIADAPLYTMGVFRAFADRTLTISPENFGPGNTTDRYSRRYRDLVSLAAAKLYSTVKLSDDQVVMIAQCDADISSAVLETNRLRVDANTEWRKQAELLGVKPGTPTYDLERANFYQIYLPLLRDQREKVTRAQALKYSIRLASFGGDLDAAQLCRVFERTIAEESLQPLPSVPDIETKYGLDAITIGQAAQSGLYAFEKELGIDPSSSLTNMLDNEGRRELFISNDHQAEYKHDSAWSGSASGGWSFFSAKASAASESHFRQSIQNLESIKISCEYMGEYWIRRRDWFDSTIFENKYVVDHLDDHDMLAAALALCTSSMMIIRGLSLEYKFKHVDDTTVWSSWSASGGGGFSAFGWGFGGSGSASGSKYSKEVNTNERTVTFKDDKDVCRLAGLRASRMFNLEDDVVALTNRQLGDSFVGRAVMEAWRNGELKYGQLPSRAAMPEFVTLMRARSARS